VTAILCCSFFLAPFTVSALDGIPDEASEDSPIERSEDSPEQKSSSGGAGLLLSGGIKHAQEMEPLAPALQAGSRFDERELRKIVPQDYWYRIPVWLAGVWQRDEQNVLKSRSLTWKSKLKDAFTPVRMGLFKSQAQFGWGHQVDTMGSIWNYAK